MESKVLDAFADAHAADPIAATAVLFGTGAETADQYPGVLDYIIEYTRERLSPVIARGLRAYAERDLAATTAEFTTTKAPKKTLIALAKFASVRYRKLVIIFDSFDEWLEIDEEIRAKVVDLLSEVHRELRGRAVMVFLVSPGEAPELEDSFGGKSPLVWKFPGLKPLAINGDVLLVRVVERWLANAAAPGAKHLTFDDEGLTAVAEASGGRLRRFILMAQEAVESAADRGASGIDAQAVEDAVAAAAEDDSARRAAEIASAAPEGEQWNAIGWEADQPKGDDAGTEAPSE